MKIKIFYKNEEKFLKKKNNFLQSKMKILFNRNSKKRIKNVDKYFRFGLKKIFFSIYYQLYIQI